MITPSYSNIPSSLFYSVIENTYIKNVEIISAQKAYEQILDGNFDIYLGLQKRRHLNY